MGTFFVVGLSNGHILFSNEGIIKRYFPTSCTASLVSCRLLLRNLGAIGFRDFPR